MVSRELVTAIKFIEHKLKDEKIRWTIIGSTNLALQGINITPNDIDILTNIRDIKRFLTIFREYTTEQLHKKAPLTKGYPDCLRLILNINKIQVDIIGEEDYDIYLSKVLKGNTINLTVEGLTVNCLRLEAELKAYQETNRNEKAHLIEEFLDKSK